MLIYDLEIIKAIPNKKEPRIEGIEYCGGWGDHAGMGISCLCAYDYEKDEYRVFTESNKQNFMELGNSHDILIGFNNIIFDNKVIKAVWEYHVNPYRCYDILRKIWESAHTGYSLDAMCKANFGIEKTGHGALAPMLWQQGKIGDVIDYCLHDVKMTKMLFDKIMSNGFLETPDGKILKMGLKK